MDKNLPANAGDMGLILALGRFHTPWNLVATGTNPVHHNY